MGSQTKTWLHKRSTRSNPYSVVTLTILKRIVNRRAEAFDTHYTISCAERGFIRDDLQASKAFMETMQNDNDRK